MTIELTAMNMRNIPLPVLKRFKAVCALEGRTMQEVVIEIMEKYIREKHIDNISKIV